MKQRNFVAKNAQRSGAGRHKRKDKKMAIYIDDKGRQLTVLKKNVYTEELLGTIEWLDGINAQIVKILDDRSGSDSWVIEYLDFNEFNWGVK